MAYALVSRVKGNGQNTFTTDAINTTGATLLVALWADDNNPQAAISDSNGNTWSVAKSYEPIDPASRISYVWGSPIVGAGHTFTLTGVGSAGSLQVYAFSGAQTDADPLDQATEDLAFGSTTVQPGPITPTTDDQLVMTHVNNDILGVPTIGGGFETPFGDPGSGGVYMGSASSYKIQTAAATEDPTWTNGGSGNLYATMASFKAGPAAPTVKKMILVRP